MVKSSPFEAVHEQLGARFGEFDGWRLPEHYGDVALEHLALREGCAAFDLSSFGRFQVRGADAGALLGACFGPQADITEPGRGVFVDSVRIYRTDKDFLVYCHPGRRGDLAERFAAHAAVLADVNVEDITEKTAMMGIYGPRSVEAIGKILPFNVGDLEPGGVRNLNLFMMRIVLLRGSWLGVDGMEMMCPVGAASMAAGALAKYHRRENIVPGGMRCFEAVRTESPDTATE